MSVPSVRGTGEAAPQCCAQFWVPSLQKKILRPWSVSGERQQNCERSGAQVVGGAAEGAGLFSLDKGGLEETLLLSTNS